MGFKVVVGTPDGNKTVHEIDEWVNRVSVNTSRGEATSVGIDKDQVELFLNFEYGDPSALGGVEHNYGVEYFTEAALDAREKNANLKEDEDPVDVPVQEAPAQVGPTTPAGIPTSGAANTGNKEEFELAGSSGSTGSKSSKK